ncbi:MAG: hypothetical protein WA474_12745 [Candidatus Sulfotelmatobacter sp.]
MKKLMVVFLAFTPALWGMASGRTPAQQSGSQQGQNYPSQSNTSSNQNMSGNVSSNGKTFTNDKDNKSYKVDNPATLKGHEGQHVAVIVHVDPDTGVIHVMQVAVPDQQ